MCTLRRATRTRVRFCNGIVRGRRHRCPEFPPRLGGRTVFMATAAASEATRLLENDMVLPRNTSSCPPNSCRYCNELQISLQHLIGDIYRYLALLHSRAAPWSSSAARGT